MQSTRRKFLSTGMGGLLGLGTLPLLGSLAGCQSTPGARTARNARLQKLPLTPTVSVINEAPGNVVALQAADGVVLVDSGSIEFAGAVQGALGAPVRTLFNTHYHADQTGGNALFRAGGAEIHSHIITKQWLATDYYVPADDRWVKAPDKQAVPTHTFRDAGEMKAGNERIEYGYLLEAHTRGDIYVYFRDANVLVVGDVGSPLRDPVHDWYAGGWLGGRVDAMDLLLKLANEQTQIVPAYGAVMTRAEFQAERDMMLKLFEKTAALTAKGGSARDMFDQGLINEVSRKFQDPLRFFYDVAKGYQAHYTNIGVNVV